MKYCFWLSEIDPAQLLDPAAQRLAVLSQAGLPVLPAWILLPAAASAFFRQPHLSSLVRREARLARSNHSAASGAVAAIRSEIMRSPLPPDVSAQLQRYAASMRAHLMHAADAALPLRISLGNGTVRTMVATARDLEDLVRRAFCLLITASVLADGEKVDISLPALLQYAPSADSHGTVERSGDETVAHVQVISHPDESYRYDHKSGAVLSAPLDHRFTALDSDAVRRLAAMVATMQAALPVSVMAHWVCASGRLWIQSVEDVTSVTVLAEHQAVQGLLRGVPANAGRARGFVRRIRAETDRNLLCPGDIAVLESVRSSDYEWLSSAGALVSAYGGSSGIASDLGSRLGIPAVAGLLPAELDMLVNGQQAHVDGFAGVVRLGEVSHSPVQRQIRTASTRVLACAPVMEAASGLNDGLLAGQEAALLELRSLQPQEILARGRADEYRELASEELVRAAKLAFPRPLFYRFHDGHQSDAGSRLDGISRGERGLRRSLLEPQWLQVEWQVLARSLAAGANNLIPMSPLVHRLEDVTLLQGFCRQYDLSNTLLERLWITVATPAVAIQAEEISDISVAGICLDLELLAQLTLGTDSGGMRFGHTVDAAYPAVLKQMEYLLEAAASAGTPSMVNFDGVRIKEAIIRAAVRAGADYLAVPPPQVASVRNAVDAAGRECAQERLLAIA